MVERYGYPPYGAGNGPGATPYRFAARPGGWRRGGLGRYSAGRGTRAGRGLDASDMGEVRLLGRRIELVSMDPHFHDISIGLYERTSEAGGVGYLAHSYARVAGTAGRLDELVGAMARLGGMERLEGEAGALRFACGEGHRTAVKRIFLEAAKLEFAGDARAPEARVEDKKFALDVTVTGLGQGRYQVVAAGESDRKEMRIRAIAGGLKRLAELDDVAEQEGQVAFPCGAAHDALVALLLPRALNVRAAMREQEAMLARGILAAPSAQAGPGSF